MERELPKNWVMGKLGDLLLIERGGSPRPIEKYLTDSDDGLNWIKISDATASGKYIYRTKQKITKDGLVKTRYVKSGDFILSNSMSFGRPYIMKTDGCIHDGWLALKDGKVKVFESEYLYYLLSSSFVFNQFDSLASGSTVRNLNKDLVASVNVKIPPLSEQNRIVAKLDTLFAQHEAMKKALERIPELLKDFRQQVLKLSIAGKLTEKWRIEKGLKSWRVEKSSECCEKVQSGGTPKGSNFSEYGIPFLKVYNIVNNNINFHYNPQWVSEEIHNSQLKKSIGYPEDVIMNIVGPPLNKIGILTDEYKEWNLNQAITLFRTKKYLSNKFLYFFFCEGSSVRSLINETKGVVGQINISLSQCREFEIPIPSLEEQYEIVNKIESLFKKVDIIEKRYKTLKEKINSLPQAILHKAFKGELVPQLPTDGDAKDLLKEILKLKSEVKKK